MTEVDFAKIFVPYVMPTDEAEQAIDHDDLAVVAEVDLKAVEPSAAGGEGMDLHTTITQRLAVTCRQRMAADTVV